MSGSMNWGKLRRQRAGAKQNLPIVGDPDRPAESGHVENPARERFVPRNQRVAVRDERGRLINPSDWRQETRTLPGQPANPFTETESGDGG